MARSQVFTLNGKATNAGFIPPANAKATDPLGAALFPSPSMFVPPADRRPGQKVTINLNPDDPLFTQVFGYIAPKGQCILSNDPNECWLVPPSPTGYGYAMQGETWLTDGSVIQTANLGGDAGHAPIDKPGLRYVQEFYENTSSQLARVVYGEDEYGVYAVGAAAPDMTWGAAVKMLASATSGDWRWVDEMGAWDFLGSCLVNVPALPLHDGAKLIRKASATPLVADRVMIVTVTGDVYTEEPTMHEAPCSCGSKSKTAAAEPGSDPSPAFGAVEVRAIVADALAANNAEWQTKFDALSDRLASYEPVLLGVLDNAAV